jgi:glycosyltransferase involved in cell wall biosynthesis
VEEVLNILMVTPHLPPYQSANSLLPHLLGEGLTERGHGVRFITFGTNPGSERVAYVRRRRRGRATKIPQALEAAETFWKASPFLDASDLVHIHSNTWMNQVVARLARRRQKPYLLTHYGTEIWHHDGRDEVFRSLNREASHVTFYSQALLEKARALAVPLRGASVVYPPVASDFRPLSEEHRLRVRERFVNGHGALLLNVKRLHPLADHATLLAAMTWVRERHSSVRLLIAGSGEREADLKERAKALSLEDAVHFLGALPNTEVAELQGAADLFVLSSRLEATPTVALEALACGTPVVSTDNPGGLELRGLFGEDVLVVPMGDPGALAAAIVSFLDSPRRTREGSARLIADRFRLDAVVDRYVSLYGEALGT